MLKIISRLPFNYFGRYCDFILTLPISLTFSITYKCNFKCKTCNIWNSNYDGNELDLTQIDSIFHSLGKSLYWITIDGGEPFLRKDLADICEIIYKNCRPAIINIPSNGSLPEEIVDSARRILSKCPKTDIIINLSLDHIGEKHDAIRNYTGSFRLLLKTYRGLKGIANSRLRIGFNTVISNYNINDWKEIYSFAERLMPDSHLFEIAQLRDEFRNRNLGDIVPKDEDSILLLKQLSALINIDRRSHRGRSLYVIRKNYYSLIKKNILFKRQSVPCFAGIASAYILPDGKVWSCCNNAQVFGDLRQYGFNFRKLWRQKPATSIRRRIRQNRCFCLQANSNYLNSIHSPLSFGKLIYNYLFG